MSIIVRDGTNTARTITAVVVRDGGNVARTISEIYVRDSTNTSRLVYTTASPLSASASPSDVFGYILGGGTATTDATTVTPAGGSAPYTYAWTLVSDTSAVDPTANSPTSASTDFDQTSMAPDDAEFAVFRCTVTDALLATATADVNATFYSAS